ncbi:MAG TPA: hypothetical protein VG326_21330 [Tepidisphaeraceae bacterium]|jgi:hypothetical protein|nr:hypothetical protein [Tepidisphaeraceae bacterium]
MAVIISEFEVLAPPKSADSGSKPAAETKTPVSTQDVQRIIRHEIQRLQRVRAH